MTRQFTLRSAVSAAFLLLAGASARADVTLPALFTNNLVLQQGKPVHIFGKAEPGEKVTVEIEGRKADTVASPEGKWLVTLKSLAAGGPYTLNVEGKNKLSVSNVLVGEVWLCSGQSNMELNMRTSFNSQSDIAASADDKLRLFQVRNVRSDKPLEDVQATWQVCGPESVPNFSAVAYYFARELRKTLNVPIGLIQSDWGGTPAEAWTREAVITNDPKLKEIADRYPNARTAYEKALADYPAVVEKAKADGKPEPRRPNAPWKYGELYNGMIAPLVNYTIRGAIWYQGESNSGRAAQYSYLFPAMIQNWRNDFGQGDFPFLLVQLAPYSSGNSAGTPYAELRESQQYSTKMKNVGMAVITDVGEENDIHPKKKEQVGVRLSLQARKIAYSEKIVADGPTLKESKVSGNKIVLKFDNVGNGLEARGGDISQRPLTDGTLVGFTIAAADGKFVPATATIVGKDTVEVSAPEVTDPTTVRYGFVNFPVTNLFNSLGLPASPFRTDVPKMPELSFPKN